MGAQADPKAPSRRPLICALVFLCLACIGLIVGVIILALNRNNTNDTDKGGDKGGSDGGPPVDDGPELSYAQYRYAAVTSENHQCNKIATDMLARGGSAVDAAIAGMLCVGVVSPHYTGLGGGFLMTVYDKQSGDTEKSVKALNAREVAPIGASQDMYINSSMSSREGGSAIGVPGELAGYQMAHDLYGKLPWKDLFAPAIALAKESKVSGSLARNSRIVAASIRKHEGLREQFLNNNETYKAGETIRMEKLAQTLETIAEEGAEAFYNGSLSQDIVDEITEAGGIITLEDLRTYKPVLKDAVSATILGDTLTAYGPPPPSSAIIVAFLLNILDGYNMTKDTPKALLYHRSAEAMKFAFGKRSLLGDADFAENITEWINTLTSREFAESFVLKINDDKTFEDVMYYEPAFDILTDDGTSQLSVLAADGSAVSMTSTLNLYFGSKVRGSRTGIIFNNEMDDFSTPGSVNAFGVPSSPQNYIAPGKRPMSSMSPMLLVDDQGVVRANLGSAGGTRIITAITQTIVNSLMLGMSIDDAVAHPRIHHQLLPDTLMYESGLPKDVVSALELKGHKVEEGNSHRWFGGAMAILNECGKPCTEEDEECYRCIKATADWRAEEDARRGPDTEGY